MSGELVARLEVASGPDRQIDREIAKAVDPTIWSRATNWASMPCGAPADVIERDAILWVPAYTESLDAALALAERVLPGWGWQIERDDCIDIYYAWVGEHFYLAGPTEALRGIADSPAPALCIAILKATTPGKPSSASEGVG